MLDLDLDLEADLGMDTVKQAELFAAARSHYGIPRREDLILADYNTLRKVVGFMQENVTLVAPQAESFAGDQPVKVDAAEFRQPEEIKSSSRDQRSCPRSGEREDRVPRGDAGLGA